MWRRSAAAWAVRRRRGRGAAPASLVSGSFVLDENRRVLLKAGKPIELTQVEFQIMELFFRNPGVALVRERILKGVWGENYFGDVKIVDVNIRRLRMKVEDEPAIRHISSPCGDMVIGGRNNMRSGITRRWLRGSLLITVLLVLLVEVMFLYSATRSYYNGVQQTMYRRFSSITGQLKMYTGETSQKTAASRSVALRRMVEQFSDKDKYEFMLLDSYGGVIASSSGTDAEGIVTHTDFEQAQDAWTAGHRHLPHPERRDGHGGLLSRTLCSRRCGRHASRHQSDAGGRTAQTHRGGGPHHGCGGAGLYHHVGPVLRAEHRGAAGTGGAHRRRHRPG